MAIDLINIKTSLNEQYESIQESYNWGLWYDSISAYIGSFGWKLYSIIAVAALVFIIVKIRHFKQTQHKKNVRKSFSRIRRLSRIKNPQTLKKKLRNTDHFLFEEIILSCFQKMGHKIKRNGAYTGDGGIDGQVFIKGKWYLIQSKRYSNYIDHNHVRDFIEVCQKRRQPGFFVHTGKTGQASSQLFHDANNVYCVSDHLLCGMFDDKRRKYWANLLIEKK